MNLDGNGVQHHAIQVFQVCHGMDWSPPTVAPAFHASPSSPGSDGYFDIMRCTHTHTHMHRSATCLWPEGPHLGNIPSRVPVSCWNLSFQECRTALQTGPLDCGFRPSSGPKSRSIEKQSAAEPRRGAWKKSLTMLPNWLTKPWNSVKAWWFSWVPWGSKFSTEFKSMWKRQVTNFWASSFWSILKPSIRMNCSLWALLVIFWALNLAFSIVFMAWVVPWAPWLAVHDLGRKDRRDRRDQHIAK